MNAERREKSYEGRVYRKKLIIAGVSTEVCPALPPIRATGLGYEAYGVIEPSGTFSETIGGSLSKKTRLNCPMQ